MEPIENNNIDNEPEFLNLDPQEVAIAAEKDLNVLAALADPSHMLYLFPPMFLTIWEFLKSKIHLFRDFSKLAVGIPRGFAKTAIIKLFIIYCILFTKKKCIIIISHTEEHGINIIRDVCSMLSHPNIVKIFGWYNVNQERDQAACKIFAFRGRTIILGAIGASGTLRGLNLDNERPDVMIFEDYQSKEDSENDELSLKIYKKMIGTFMKSNSPFGCLYIFVANMYPTTGSILKKLKNNPDWLSLIVGAITERGESLWEELHPIKQLLEEYKTDLNAGAPEQFLSEKLNDENAGIKSGIDITTIPRFPWDEHELPEGRAIIIDPATDNAKADYNGIGVVGVYDGIGVLEHVKLGKFSPFERIKEALRMAFAFQVRLICVENVALQKENLFWFNKICEDNGISGFYFECLNIGTAHKAAKIKDGLAALMKKEQYIKEQVRPLLINEVIKWDPMKQKNQDTVLDLNSMVRKVIEQHQHLMAMPYEAEMISATAAKVLSEEENCCF